MKCNRYFHWIRDEERRPTMLGHFGNWASLEPWLRDAGFHPTACAPVEKGAMKPWGHR
jgi:hypothetical protein